jgi:hypothetical protein
MEADRRGLVRRIGRGLFGEPPLDRLAHTTVLSSAADAFVAVSLAGSLFFNVSIDAARPRIIGYLAMTMAPFAVVAPLIGPFVDRVRGGHRVVIAAACLGRAVLCLLLARDLRSLLLYPEAFSILVLNKTHSVAKSALVPRLVGREEELVRSNARLSRVSSAGGALGGLVAVNVIAFGSATAVLVVGACCYLAALATVVRIPAAPSVPRRSPVTELAGEQELRSPSLRLGLSSMLLLRGAVGFLAFFAAFTLKGTGSPTWVFGAVLVGAGVGGFLGTFIAPVLRRLLIEERLLELALAAPAVVVLIVPATAPAVALLVTAFAMGLAANVGRQAFDSVVQREAPDAERGRAFARFEARLQLAWVAGALLPVLVLPGPTTGLLAMAAVLFAGAVGYGTTARTAVRHGWGSWLAATLPRDYAGEDAQVPLAVQLLDTARWLRARGALRQSASVLAGALRSAGDGGGGGATEELVVRAEALAREAVDGAVDDAAVSRLLDEADDLIRRLTPPAGGSAGRPPADG